ncbi:MAG: OadG family protein [Clostridia bacterium]|nr:OadG family protein [Clostridia bacterium]
MEINGFADTLLVAVVGMLVVFFGLVILIMLIKLMGILTGGMGKKEAPKAAPAPVAAPVAAPAPEGKLSPAKFDDETVAVITAAIAAERGEGYPFKIKRIVRVKQ